MAINSNSVVWNGGTPPTQIPIGEINGITAIGQQLLTAASQNAARAVIGADSPSDTRAPSTHDHDTRYYTEAEVSALLAGKSDVGHNHDTAYYTKAQVDAAVTAAQQRRCTKFGEIKNAYGMAIITTDNQVMSWGIAENGVYSIGEAATGIPSVNMFNGTRTGKLTKLVGNRNNMATLTDSNELWIKGANDVGQLGLGDTTNTGIRYRAFHKVTIANKTIVDVWIGGSDVNSTYFVVLCSDGTAFAWGYNSYGQLCVNNTTNYSSPQSIAIPSGSTAFATFSLAPIAAAHTLARTTDGKLHVGGNNNYGQLGMGDTTQRNQLTTVSGKLVTTIQAIGSTDATPTHIGSSQIILTSGVMQMAGYNTYGHLGINSTTSSNVFTNTTLNHTDVSKLAANFLAGQALGGYVTTAKIAWVAGYNLQGNLGNGTTTQSNIYVQPSGAFQGFVDKLILSYPNGVSVIMAAGEVWCSGYGGQGGNGDGAVVNRTTFGKVAMIETIVDIIVANAHTAQVSIFALGVSGRVYSWGYNTSYGIAGQGHLNAVYVPCEVQL